VWQDAAIFSNEYIAPHVSAMSRHRASLDDEGEKITLQLDDIRDKEPNLVHSNHSIAALLVSSSATIILTKYALFESAAPAFVLTTQLICGISAGLLGRYATSSYPLFSVSSFSRFCVPSGLYLACSLLQVYVLLYADICSMLFSSTIVSLCTCFLNMKSDTISAHKWNLTLLIFTCIGTLTYSFHFHAFRQISFHLKGILLVWTFASVGMLHKLRQLVLDRHPVNVFEAAYYLNIIWIIPILICHATLESISVIEHLYLAHVLHVVLYGIVSAITLCLLVSVVNLTTHSTTVAVLSNASYTFAVIVSDILLMFSYTRYIWEVVFLVFPLISAFTFLKSQPGFEKIWFIRFSIAGLVILTSICMFAEFKSKPDLSQFIPETYSKSTVLVVIYGELRGGLMPKISLLQNVLAPLHADLALLGPPADIVKHPDQKYLIKRAKYQWVVEEPEDWETYLALADTNGVPVGDILNKICKAFPDSQFLGGIKRCQYGSGAIQIAYRLLALKQFEKLKRDKVEYEWIIYTRSDYIWPCKIWDVRQFPPGMYVPFGEGYAGYTDRIAIVHKQYVSRVFDLARVLFADDAFLDILREQTDEVNIELILRLQYEFQNIPVTQFHQRGFTVKKPSDHTRWSSGRPDLRFDKYNFWNKYHTEIDETDISCAQSFPAFNMWDALDSLWEIVQIKP